MTCGFGHLVGREEKRLFRFRQRVESSWKRGGSLARRIHPVGLRDDILETGAGHECQKLLRQRIFRAGRGLSGQLDLEIIAFRISQSLIALSLFRDHVIGGRCRIGQHHWSFALGEEAVGLRPAGRDGQDTLLQFLPGRFRLIAID